MPAGQSSQPPERLVVVDRSGECAVLSLYSVSKRTPHLDLRRQLARLLLILPSAWPRCACFVLVRTLDRNLQLPSLVYTPSGNIYCWFFEATARHPTTLCRLRTTHLVRCWEVGVFTRKTEIVTQPSVLHTKGISRNKRRHYFTELGC